MERAHDTPVVPHAPESEDIERQDEEENEEEEEEQGWKRPRDLPSDLPRSLDDRRRDTTAEYGGETEYYDGWQGTCPGQICNLIVSDP